MLAHWFGLFGEVFNCVGAVILALDILLRGKARKDKRTFEDMSSYAKSAGSNATYRGVPVASPDFAEEMVDFDAVALALRGVICLLLGFALLVAYHTLELHEVGKPDKCANTGRLTNTMGKYGKN